MAYEDEKSTETTEGLLSYLETPKIFSPEQLRTFTSNFSTSLGSGGFGDVYKGTLDNGVQVAVKVLKGALLSDGVKDQFKAELRSLGNIHHKHVVNLYGFCFEQNMKALVYEFMENGSLDKLLYGNQSIAWETLCKIAVGTAKGLVYLHEYCQPRILHYDVKPANILLDSKFSPKVSDFGLAKFLNQDTTHITESRFRGTPNYVAPELLMPYSWATRKCDVFSFGISLFDIIGRRKHVRGEGEKWFPVQVWKKFKEEKQEEIIQECGIQEKDGKQAKRILLIALQCVQPLPDDRPSMRRVVKLLEGTEEVKLPLNPFLYIASSSALTESVRQEDNISRTTLGPWGGRDGSHWNDEIFVGILLIALRCIQPLSGDRPSMSPVVRLLEGTEEVKQPQNPFLMHVDSSSAVTESGRREDNISRTTFGPWGGREGSHWDDGIFDGIKKIKVFKDIKGNVFGIQVWYCGKGGESISTRRHEDREADTIDTMELDYPSEYLMRVTGFYGYEFGNNGLLLVRSLCFFTNKKIYGPFGDERGIYFTSENDGKDGKVVGFHGRNGHYLHAIGLYMEYNKDHQEKLKENDAINVTRLKPTTVGPWGGLGGVNWDDQVSSGIKKIEIYKGKEGDVRSMRIWYCGRDGDPIWSQRHGYEGTHRHGYEGTHTTDTIELDYPSEYLVRVTGFHGYEFGGTGFDLVRSICFFSNNKKYGPFGEEKGSYFSTEKDGKDGKVIGFHGRAGYYLNAIGMHMDYSS